MKNLLSICACLLLANCGVNVQDIKDKEQGSVASPNSNSNKEKVDEVKEEITAEAKIRQSLSVEEGEALDFLKKALKDNLDKFELLMTLDSDKIKEAVKNIVQTVNSLKKAKYSNGQNIESDQLKVIEEKCLTVLKEACKHAQDPNTMYEVLKVNDDSHVFEQGALAN
ncbi:hypothetical protein DB313_05105 (plasmid) [Borrelia turcica IST7]|uniref:Mlp family lipoprotein n=1 Tax=Borrelia turcica IST7 TaxID=1104446 RepID=A0A386PNP0_9SPIR|nr:hypothetical protein [Borrelia turcica]AYE36878.1 hypothetical protein DB313_05105 [Borrelia turcica IST7]